MDEIEIVPPNAPPLATVHVPGSKSITNRAMVIAAMASGRSVIESALISDDTRWMAEGLMGLGFSIEADEARCSFTAQGLGGRIPLNEADLFVGGAGTAMRFLSAFLTLGHGHFRIDGNARMRERPMRPLIDAMRRLGADIRSENRDGYPPIIANMGADRFAGGQTSVDTSISSQFASALILPAPLWSDGLRLEIVGDTGRPFVEMTLRVMKSWGVETSVEGRTVVVPGGRRYTARRFVVEPDASSASYFAAAAALLGGSVRIARMRSGSVQGDVGFLGLLTEMGARIEWLPDGVEVSGGSDLRGIDVEMSAMPDMVPTLAAIAPFASSPTRIRGVGFIRHHESDRLRALATELRRIGASVIEHEDGLRVDPSSRLHPAAIETYDDHRIAMSFAVTGLRLKGMRIRNPACVSKTFPAFFEELKRLGASVQARS